MNAIVKNTIHYRIKVHVIEFLILKNRVESSIVPPIHGFVPHTFLVMNFWSLAPLCDLMILWLLLPFDNSYLNQWMLPKFFRVSWMFRTFFPVNDYRLVRPRIHIQRITKMLKFGSKGQTSKIQNWKVFHDMNWETLRILGELAWSGPLIKHYIIPKKTPKTLHYPLTFRMSHIR